MPIENLNNEPELLERIAEGDERVFARIYEKYYPLAALFATRFVGPEAAADIVAEVFIKLWRQPKKYESFQHFIASLRAITRNLCIDRLRSEKTSQTMIRELEYLAIKPYEELYYQESIEENLHILILQEIERLPDYLKQIFILAYIEGLSNAEIAEKLQMKDSTVRTKKSQALEILRTKLNKLPLAIATVLLLEELAH